MTKYQHKGPTKRGIMVQCLCEKGYGYVPTHLVGDAIPACSVPECIELVLMSYNLDYHNGKPIVNRKVGGYGP